MTWVSTWFWTGPAAAVVANVMAVIVLAYVVCRRLVGRRCGVCGRKDIPLVERMTWTSAAVAEVRRCCRRCARRIDREERMYQRANATVGAANGWRRYFRGNVTLGQWEQRGSKVWL